MSTAAALAALGCVLLYLGAHVVFDFFFDVTFDATKEAVFRRPSFAQRRERSRGLLRSGCLSGVLALATGFLGIAVLTNGFDDEATARTIFAVAVGLAVLSSVLLSVWWRRAGRPRHY